MDALLRAADVSFSECSINVTSAIRAPWCSTISRNVIAQKPPTKASLPVLRFLHVVNLIPHDSLAMHTYKIIWRFRLCPIFLGGQRRRRWIWQRIFRWRGRWCIYRYCCQGPHKHQFIFAALLIIHFSTVSVREEIFWFFFSFLGRYIAWQLLLSFLLRAPMSHLRWRHNWDTSQV